jgi:hypothetical protein
MTEFDWHEMKERPGEWCYGIHKQDGFSWCGEHEWRYAIRRIENEWQIRACGDTTYNYKLPDMSVKEAQAMCLLLMGSR